MEKKRKILNIGLRIFGSPIGSLFFLLTKPIFKNKKGSRWADAWWYCYLYWFARHYRLKKLRNKNKGYRLVKKLMPDYDYFLFYNTVFHVDALSHIVYELSQGYIPVIDDTWHVWDQFFEQPVILAGEAEPDREYIPVSDVVETRYTPQAIPYCKPNRVVGMKLMRDFCRLRPEVDAYIQEEIHQLLDGHRVLGIVRRGTDYIGTGMYIQPKMDDLIRDARQWMEAWHYDRIYLATEDERIFDRFNAEFPGQILVNKRSYYDKAMTEQNVKWIGQVHFDRENDNYLKGLEYLSSLYILSNCQALLAGACGGTNIAILLNQGRYEHWKVYDLGCPSQESWHF